MSLSEKKTQVMPIESWKTQKHSSAASCWQAEQEASGEIHA